MTTGILRRRVGLAAQRGADVRPGRHTQSARAAHVLVLDRKSAVIIPAVPPLEHFDDPKLSKPTPLTIDPDGRIYGHVSTNVVEAEQGGSRKSSIAPKLDGNDAHFYSGQIVTAEGKRVTVGTLTFVRDPFSTAPYDHTGAVVAEVVVGGDSHGTWFSGSLRHVPPGFVDDLRHAEVTARWRRMNGRQQLLSLTAVNTEAVGLVASATIAHPSRKPVSPYVGRALNHRRPFRPHDLIDSATYFAAFDSLRASGAAVIDMQGVIVEGERAAVTERRLAAGEDVTDVETVFEADSVLFRSVTYRACPLGPSNRPGVIAAACFVGYDTKSEWCPNCGHRHTREVPRRKDQP